MKDWMNQNARYNSEKKAIELISMKLHLECG